MRPPLFAPDRPSPPAPLAELGAGSLPDGRGENEPVGYSRPPQATRFRPGQSGNPRGRRARTRVSSLVARALEETVEARENGRVRTISKLEATVTQLVNRAATGDQRATLLVFSLLREDQARPEPSAPRRLDEGDDLVIAELVRRLSQPAQ